MTTQRHDDWYYFIVSEGGHMEGKLPKYYLLKKEILNKIETGEYQEGSMIESERELMERYQFSRITVRKAIDEW